MSQSTRVAGLAAVLLVLGFFTTQGVALADDPSFQRPSNIDLTRYGRLHRSVVAPSAPLLFVAPAYTELAPGGGGNPFPNGLAETFSAPTLADIDNDGDLDLVSGENLGGFVYLENQGDNTTPNFVQLTGASNPFDGIDIGDKTTPRLVDIDGDGDYDVIAGRNDGQYRFIENTGNASTPTYSQSASMDNPLDGVDSGNRSAPAFADLDGDGDYDMVTGDIDGTLKYYENTGDANNPAFSLVSGVSSPVDGFDVGDHSNPAFADVDNDGDLDLLVGEDLGTFVYYENQGDANTPNFVNVTGASNPFDGFDAGDKSTVAFADLDNASGVDMVSGNTLGDYYFYENADPLPVELTSFNVVSNGRDLTLTWTTASELNNAGFEIQQRVGRKFEVVGWVDGAGTTNEARSYSYTITRKTPGRQAFRLRQVDFDGAFAFSGTREISIALDGSFHLGDVFPNPFNPQASFTLTVAQTQNVTVGVYDMQGRMISLLHSGSLLAEQPYQFRVDGSAWASGKYIVRAVGERFESSRIVTLLK